MPLTKKTRQTALNHLKSKDPTLRSVIDRVGEFTLRPAPDRFSMLVRSILSQQISVSAARTIRERLLNLLDNRWDPHAILALRESQMRAAGVSAQKAKYLFDLARHVTTGELQLSQIGRQSDEAIISKLVEVKGIGRWTAQMFLIFALGRADVLPHDDLGIQTAIQKLYHLRNRPGRDEIEQIAAPWRPYASVASWYCWRSLDSKT